MIWKRYRRKTSMVSTTSAATLSCSTLKPGTYKKAYLHNASTPSYLGARPRSCKLDLVVRPEHPHFTCKPTIPIHTSCSYKVHNHHLPVSRSLVFQPDNGIRVRYSPSTSQHLPGQPRRIIDLPQLLAGAKESEQTQPYERIGGFEDSSFFMTHEKRRLLKPFDLFPTFSTILFTSSEACRF